MADNSIALQVQTPNAMNTIGNMLNVANQSVALKKAQATLQPDIARSQAESKSAQTASEFSRWKLDETQAQKAYEIAGSLTADPAIVSGDSEGSVKALMEAEDRMRAYGIPESKIRVQMGPMYAMAAHNPKQLHQTLKNVITGGLNASGQASAITPSGPMMNTGQVQQQVNTNPLAGPNGPIPGTTAQNVLPPSTPTVDAQGNPVYLGSQNQGPVAAGPKLGAVDNVADLRKEVNLIRQAGDQVGVQRNINQNILRLSKDTTTGPGTQYWQRTLAAVGLGQFGDNYQELGKFLEKNAIQNMQSMGGPPSDARLSSAAAANGSTQFNPGALQTVTKFNDATNSAVDKYRRGVDKAVGLETPNFASAARFKSEWAKNLDIDIFRVENAHRDKDTEELQKIAKELGPEKMKELAKKRRNLEALSSTGKLP